MFKKSSLFLQIFNEVLSLDFSRLFFSLSLSVSHIPFIRLRRRVQFGSLFSQIRPTCVLHHTATNIT